MQFSPDDVKEQRAEEQRISKRRQLPKIQDETESDDRQDRRKRIDDRVDRLPSGDQTPSGQNQREQVQEIPTLMRFTF